MEKSSSRLSSVLVCAWAHLFLATCFFLFASAWLWTVSHLFLASPLASLSALIYFSKMISPCLLSLFIVFGGGGGEKDLLTFRFFGEQLLPFFFHPADRITEAH